jgi:6-phosphogluconolactonase
LSGSGFQASLRSEVKTQIRMKTIATFVLIAATMGLGIYGCGGGATPSGGSNPPPNAIHPVPTANPSLTIPVPAISPVAVDPTGRFAYVVSGEAVSMYTIDPSTGALTSTGSLIDPNLGGPYSVAVHPSGKVLYLANSGTRDDVGFVSIYSIDATTGTLTSVGLGPASVYPWSMAVHPSGKFAYVTNEFTQPQLSWPSILYEYTIDPATGNLGHVTTTTAGLTPTSIPTSIAIDPSGKFAYVTNSGSNDISIYTINATTGALTSLGPIATGANPTSMAVDPTGKFAYVANFGSNDISMYSIDTATGILSSLGPIAAATSPSSVAVDPSGKFAYVANYGSNDVSMYSINTTTGVLTSTGVIAAGTQPSSIAIHPSGKFAYVTNTGSSNVSMYRIDATNGALTLIGTIGT